MKFSYPLLFILILSFGSQKTNAQALGLQWGIAFGGIYSDNANAVATDSQGNVYIVGIFDPKVDFDPGIDSFFVTKPGYSSDIYILKLSPTRDFLWVRTFHGDALFGDAATGIAIDASDNIYITGKFGGTVDFDPGPDSANLSANPFAEDAFVLKLNSAGDFIWVKQLGDSPSGSVTGWDILLDDTGNIFVTGTYRGKADFDPSIDSVFQTSNGGSDVFMIKLDNSGDLLWVNTMGGPAFDTPSRIAIDNQGNTYVIGYFEGIINAVTNTGTEQLISNGAEDIFIGKYDTFGNIDWVFSQGGISNDYGYDVIVDNNGNIYTVGTFKDIVDFDPDIGINNQQTNNGERASFFQKLNNQKNLEWVKVNNGYSLSTVKKDNQDFFYLTGNIGNSNVLFSKKDAQGNSVMEISMSSTLFGGGIDLALDNSQNVYITGNFEETIDLDPGPKQISYTSLGNEDAFLMKLSSTGLSTPELDNKLDVSIYPNPATSLVTIENNEKVKMDITITNLTGEKVYSTHTSKTIALNVSEFTSGIYFVSAISKNGSFVQKLIIE